MVEILKALQKQYGDLHISEIIEKIEVKPEITHYYWIRKSLIGNLFISSSEKGWIQHCESIKEAEEYIKKFIEDDEKNGIKSIYDKKQI